MIHFEVGQTVTITWHNVVSGVLRDAAVEPTAVVTPPGGVEVAASVERVALGTYRVSTPGTDPGRYTFRVLGAEDGLPWSDVADVWPTDPRLVVSLAEARETLNIAADQHAMDDELRGYIVAATMVLEHLSGAILPSSVVERRSGGGSFSIGLFQMTDEIVSVTEDGIALVEGTDYCLDEHSLLWRGSRPGAGAWSPTGVRNVVVTYRVGSTLVGEDVRLAASKLLRHWWRQGEQTYSVDGPDDTETVDFVYGYAVPKSVVDLMRRHTDTHRVPGIA